MFKLYNDYQEYMNDYSPRILSHHEYLKVLRKVLNLNEYVNESFYSRKNTRDNRSYINFEKLLRCKKNYNGNLAFITFEVNISILFGNDDYLHITYSVFDKRSINQLPMRLGETYESPKVDYEKYGIFHFKVKYEYIDDFLKFITSLSDDISEIYEKIDYKDFRFSSEFLFDDKIKEIINNKTW